MGIEEISEEKDIFEIKKQREENKSIDFYLEFTHSLLDKLKKEGEVDPNIRCYVIPTPQNKRGTDFHGRISSFFDEDKNVNDVVIEVPTEGHDHLSDYQKMWVIIHEINHFYRKDPFPTKDDEANDMKEYRTDLLTYKMIDEYLGYCDVVEMSSARLKHLKEDIRMRMEIFLGECLKWKELEVEDMDEEMVKFVFNGDLSLIAYQYANHTIPSYRFYFALNHLSRKYRGSTSLVDVVNEKMAKFFFDMAFCVSIEVEKLGERLSDFNKAMTRGLKKIADPFDRSLDF